MATSNQISPGMTLSIDGKIYRVEFSVRVTVAKGVPFIKTKLKDLMSDEVIEKNFKVDQPVEEVTLSERRLEYLYLEGKDHLFLDVGELEEVLVPAAVVGDKVNYLKESIQLKAMFYGDTIFSIELPQFLELMVMKLEELKSKVSVSNASKLALLETGARVEVPLFIEVGDIIKVDTHVGEYVQRI
ncbi:elongation factor P [Simkania negevensis]|uniref:Elongation factor P n=1 Tax=Simkania negevensis (strain ATCC VR-1471 / DSM 27360 / Z) TaxID=331113 RepID=F8L9S5_SIMNZ|nr:elongation factor P [Simkania negevensis]CCB89622.1 elongation factor P 1 [Simkania negevensis Z]